MSSNYPGVRRTQTTLADGRDFFYFDDSPEYVSGEKTRRLDDPRPLTDRYAPVVDENGVEHPITGPTMRGPNGWMVGQLSSALIVSKM